jgi:hypothetical protein
MADEQYEAAVRFCSLKGGEQGIDACLKKHDLDVLITLHSGMASSIMERKQLAES